jgi:F-type H+-transporting ATPase subunit b
MRHTRIVGLLGAGAAALVARPALAAEAGAQPGIINLDVTLIIQAVNFLILILLLSRFLFRPLTGFLRERAEGIRRSLEEATAAREAAVSAHEEHRAAILAAQREAAALREQTQRDVETERQRLQAAARAEAERLLAQAREEIAAETRRARATLREDAVSLSAAITERLLGRAVTSEDQRRLAEEYVREMGTRN